MGQKMSKVARALTVSLVLWIIFMSMRIVRAYKEYAFVRDLHDEAYAVSIGYWSNVKMEVGFMLAVPMVIIAAYAALRWILAGSD